MGWWWWGMYAMENFSEGQRAIFRSQVLSSSLVAS